MKVLTLLLCLISIFFLVSGVTAANKDYPDVIEFAGAIDGGGSKDIHPSTSTGPVTFPHGKHVNDYGASCPDCHHFNDAMSVMGSGSTESLRCGNCHEKEGLIRGPTAENDASDSDLIAHRANVLHMLCIGCHQKHNNTMRVVRIPESCITCHAKHPQGWVIK